MHLPLIGRLFWFHIKVNPPDMSHIPDIKATWPSSDELREVICANPLRRAMSFQLESELPENLLEGMVVFHRQWVS